MENTMKKKAMKQHCDKLTIMYCRTILGAWPAFLFSLVYIALLTLVIEQVSHS